MPKYTQKERSDLSKKAVDLLRAGHDVGDVSRLLNVSVRSIQRWRRGEEGVQVVALAQAVDAAPNAISSSYDLPSDQNIRNKIQSLTTLALSTIEGILRCPDSRSTEKLRACALILDASGHNDPAACVTSKAIDFLHRQGYEIIDPTLPTEDEGVRGFTDEAAELIKQKILFG
jgi:hypothetical protein